MSFEKQIQNPDPIIAAAATSLQQISADFATGAITKPEYDELVADILGFQKIQDLVGDQNHRNEIFKAFQQLQQIAGLITSI